jgi:hypothetical protein
VTRLIRSGDAERRLALRVRAADDLLSQLREKIRSGGQIDAGELEALG